MKADLGVTFSLGLVRHCISSIYNYYPGVVIASRNTLSTFEPNFVFMTLFLKLLPHKLFKFHVPLNLDFSLAKTQM